MPRPRTRIAPAACLIPILSALLVAARAQEPRGVDPERAFSFGDADLDGRLGFDEFRDLLRDAARRKKAAGKGAVNLQVLFGRLDLDRDGHLSPVEYREMARSRAGGPGPMAGPARNPARPAPGAADRPIAAEQARFFESKIRPVLATKCIKCHSGDSEKPKGGLRVDTPEGLRRGGDAGPAVVPGDLDASRLVAAIRHEDGSPAMPPKDKLPDEVIADFEEWIRLGAPDPRESSGVAPWVPDIAGGRDSWAFQPPRASRPPEVADASWPRSDLDRFLLAAIEAKGLKPVPDAGRHALIRRASFDLIGLPPTPEEVAAFVVDDSPGAFARVVDRLLASPRFGERWGRHWLDVARYAESSGKANMMYPQAWRYRDWVIASFNADKPYDQFVAQQVAGDLMAAEDDRGRAELAIATGFLAIGGKAHNTQDRRQFLVDVADEQIEVTGLAFLGLTVACARCHDHKFDPISQRDYYALSGIFRSTQARYGTLPGVIQNANPSPLIELPAGPAIPSALPPLTPDRRAELEAQAAELTRARDALTPEDNFLPKGFQTRTRLAMVRFRLASYRPDGTPRRYAMGAVERPEPVDSPLYVRGELDKPAEVVPRGLPRIAGPGPSAPIGRGSGRRELARWLASPDNPLTARVMVNRIWLHLFGRGLVPTPDNFGASGEPPSHPELLDTLAVSFMEGGWSVKATIRRLVLSRAYQLSSTADPASFAVDPDNALVWRMTPRRLEAEALRDAILATSGQLDLVPPTGSAVALAGEGPAGPARGFGRDGQDRHRAVYLPVVRDQLPESLALFDFADPGLATGERPATGGPTQALYLMNSPFVIRQAEAAAARLLAGPVDDPTARVDLAYRRFLARDPTGPERARALGFLDDFAPGAGPKSAWAAFCQALYASAEFRYLD